MIDCTFRVVQHINSTNPTPWQEELDLQGIQHIGGLADADKVVGPLRAGYKVEQDPDVRAG